VFAYPESYLLPELRPGVTQTTPYHDLLIELRNQTRLTPVQARKLAEKYHAALTTKLGANLPEPLRDTALVITEQLTDTQLSERRTLIANQFGNLANPAQAPNYLQEIFYFVPLALALQLQKAGQFLSALDWIETFYADHLKASERKIYRGLVVEEQITTQYQRNPDNWLRVGLNPHEIATVRASAHTQFTLMTLVRYQRMLNEALRLDIEDFDDDLSLVRETMISPTGQPQRQAYELAVGVCNADGVQGAAERSFLTGLPPIPAPRGLWTEPRRAVAPARRTRRPRGAPIVPAPAAPP